MGESTGPIKRLASQLEKAATRITGVDEVSGGGLPRGRSTLVSGTAGSERTPGPGALDPIHPQRGSSLTRTPYDE
jgi:hypothetical protein